MAFSFISHKIYHCKRGAFHRVYSAGWLEGSYLYAGRGSFTSHSPGWPHFGHIDFPNENAVLLIDSHPLFHLHFSFSVFFFSFVRLVFFVFSFSNGPLAGAPQFPRRTTCIFFFQRRLGIVHSNTPHCFPSKNRCRCVSRWCVNGHLSTQKPLYYLYNMSVPSVAAVGASVKCQCGVAPAHPPTHTVSNLRLPSAVARHPTESKRRDRNGRHGGELNSDSDSDSVQYIYIYMRMAKKGRESFCQFYTLNGK